MPDDDAAAVHDADAVGEEQDLVEVLADQEDAGAGVARVAEPLVHRGGGAHVEAAARAVGERRRAGVPANSRAMTSFCALPPERSAAFWLGLRTPCTSKAPTAWRVAVAHRRGR